MEIVVGTLLRLSAGRNENSAWRNENSYIQIRTRTVYTDFAVTPLCGDLLYFVFVVRTCMMRAVIVLLFSSLYLR